MEGGSGNPKPNARNVRGFFFGFREREKRGKKIWGDENLEGVRKVPDEGGQFLYTG
jgi:hypothetical protein